MASSGQSPFSLYLTLASVALSLVAVTTVTTKQDGTLMNAASKQQRRKKAPQNRPQPIRRSADDGLQIETTEKVPISSQHNPIEEDQPSAGPENTSTQAIEHQQDEIAAAIARTAKLSRSLRARRANGEDVVELQSELSRVTANLCHLQQELIVNPEFTTEKDDFHTLFKSSFLSIKAAFSTVEAALKSNDTSRKTLNDVRQKLLDERPFLESLSGSVKPARLPPTPPSEAVPDVPLKPSISAEVTPQPSPRISFDTGVTPSASRVEPPPEYLPSVEPIPMASLTKSSETNSAMETSHVETTAAPEHKSLPNNDDALYSAVTENDGSSLAKLLSDGLDPTAQFGELQRTALHQAAHLNHIDCLQTLLRHGAVLSTEDAKGDTALHLAAWVGNTEAITVLLEHGADVDWLSGRDGYTPLWCAVSAHQLATAKLLLRHGAQVSLRASTGGGLMPLHQAAVTGQGSMCELLINHGAYVNCLDDDRSTPLHYAAVSGSVPAVTGLLREGAEIEARQVHGLTAAHWAAHKGHVDVLEVLLDYGARVDSRAGEGATPLHLAASRGHMRAAVLLLDRGAKKNIARASWAGVAGTPADMAKAKGHVNLARLLR